MTIEYNLSFFKECFSLLEDGTLVWKTRPRHHFFNDHGMNIFNANYPGKPVSPSIGPKGHRTAPLSYQGKRLRPSYSHAVYCLHHNTDIPEGMNIDHVDGNPRNDHPSNLELKTPKMNNRNAAHKPGRSGVVGVTLTKGGRYRASAGSHGDGEYHYFGTYDSLAEAIAARETGCRLLGYTERHIRGRTDASSTERTAA